MADNLPTAIKRTQDELGRFIKKPPLTDKNLSRPPFRFLHDVVHSVIDSTGFMSGVFSDDELDAGNVTTRDAKAAFMQKLMQVIKDKTGEDVPIKISKVLAGLEPEKTNLLLQCLAKAIEAHQGGDGGAKKGGSKKTSPVASTSKGAAKPGAKPEAKKAGASKGGDKENKKAEGPAGTKRGIRDASPGQSKAKQGKVGDNANAAPGSGSKGKRSSDSKKAGPLAPTVPVDTVEDESIPPAEDEAAPARGSASRKASGGDEGNNAGNSLPEPMDLDTGLDNLDSLDKDGGGGSVEVEHDLYDNFAASVVKPHMQTLPPPTTQILTDADAVTATMSSPSSPILPSSPMVGAVGRTPTPGHSLTPTATPSPISQIAAPQRPSTSQQGRSREPSAEQKGGPSPFGSATIGEIRPPTGQSGGGGGQIRSRPDTGTAAGRVVSARPPSARRAPPRPKSSVVKEETEPYRPTTGKVAHVILDNTEDPDDDDNYVVREVTVTASKPPGLSDLDETPELEPGGFVGDTLDVLPSDQRGLLVNQILETQKELEDHRKGDDAPVIEKKLKELSFAEIDKLKNFIQLCSRSANPLAKLLDYMAEDVDSMQKEYNGYKEKSSRLSIELENAKSETDQFLQSLKHELHEVERKVKDKQDAILASQMKIIQQEERIEEIVNGFERVRSGKSTAAEQHMPPADEILAHIQGQSSSSSGYIGSASVGPSTFSFSAMSSQNDTFSNFGRSSLQSGGGGGGAVPSAFQVPDDFGEGSGNGDMPSFNRSRVWGSSTNNNNNNNSGGNGRGTLDRGYSEDEPSSYTSATHQSGSGSFGAQRNTGRSGGTGGVGNNTFRRSATGTAAEFKMDMDVDNFNPWNN